MVEANRARVGESRIEYVLEDGFSWQPQGTFDLVFAGFFLSHVSQDRLEPFLASLVHATAGGGRLMLVNELLEGQQLSGRTYDEV
jgi:Methyltransferase domain